MADEVTVILDLSHEVQTFLADQEVDLYQQLQRELPSIRLTRQSDPASPQGSRDIVTVISVTTGLVGALAPIIMRVLNMITPPNRSRTWIVEEIETLQPDGGKTIHRKRVLSSSEQHLSESHSEHPQAAKPSSSADTTRINKR